MAKKKNDRLDNAQDVDTKDAKDAKDAKDTKDANATSSNSNARDGHTDGVDLLELGPEDGQELLEFEDSSQQRATIKVIGVGGGAAMRSIP